jgi:hypothetical protein
MQRTKTLALLYLLGATLVGGGVGYATDRYMVQDRLCAPRLTEREMRQRFYEDLALTPPQRAAWDALLEERVRSTAAVRATIRPRTDSILAEYNRQTIALLTADQRAQLDERRAAMRRGDGNRERNDRTTPNTDKNPTRK